MTDLDLVCADPFKIGLLGAMSFISFAIGSALITRFADVYGRRKVVIYSSLVTPIGLMCLIYFAKNLIVIYIFIFLIGLSYNARGSTAYIYGSEFLQTKWQTLFSIGTFTMIGITQLMSVLVFWTTKSQDTFMWILITFMIIAIFWVMRFAPESP